MSLCRVCVCVLQLEVLTQTFPVFDKFRGKFLVGEMLWTFADFATKQGMHIHSHMMVM